MVKTLLFFFSFFSFVSSQEIVKYFPKHEELKYTFGGHPPVMTLKPGMVLESWTEDCYDGAVKSPADVPTRVVPPNHDNPQTGPFYIEGARSGDVLAIQIVDLQPAREYAISSSFPGFGALNATDYTAMLHEPLPETVWWYPVNRQKGTVTFRSKKGNTSLEIPISPFLGCIATAPARGEVRWTVTPEAYGGNMDSWEVRKGTTVYLPVNVDGALLEFGDGHLVEGAGEIIGTAVESALNVKIKVDLVKGKSIAWPRFEDDEFIMTAGSYRPLEDAARIAYKEMVLWIADEFKMNVLDSYEFVSQTAVTDLAQMVDPNYTIVVKVPKKYLPKGEVMNGVRNRLK